MTATATRSDAAHGAGGGVWDLYKGWLVGLLILVIVLAVGTGLWLHFQS